MEIQNGFPTAARQLKPEKRVRIAATAAVSNKNLHDTDLGGDKGSVTRIDMERVEEIIRLWPATYAEYFQFALPMGKQYDTDKTTIGNKAAVQAVKKVKDKLMGK